MGETHLLRAGRATQAQDFRTLCCKRIAPAHASSQVSHALLRAQDRRVIWREMQAIHLEGALKQRQRASGIAAELCRDAHVEHSVCAVPIVGTLACMCVRTELL